MTLEGQNLSVLNVNKNDIFYNCIAIICHVGHDLSSGDYEAFTFEKHKWILYSDLMRQQVDIKNDAELYRSICKYSFLLLYERPNVVPLKKKDELIRVLNQPVKY